MKKTYLQPATEELLVAPENDLLTTSLGEPHSDVEITDEKDLLSRELGYNFGLFE